MTDILGRTGKDEGVIPEALKDWITMSEQQIEDAFAKTPPEFQEAVLRTLNSTECKIQWILRQLEKTTTFR